MNAKTTDSFKRTIEFRDVSYHINDIPAGVVLSDISLSIPRGETLVLLGRSGSGKTTFLKLINGMLLPSNGSILVHDRPTMEWDPIRLRRGIGYVIQEAGLFPHFTVAENLSGGQRQRVGVARALAADPPILLMDEPFGALDPVTRAELQREFSALARRLGKTIVFVTHDLREALLLASRIVLLQGGRMVASASPQEFLRLDHPEVRAFTASLIVAPGVPA